MSVITARTIQSISPKSTPYVIRDSKLKGFAIKVNPSGKLKFVIEVWHDGRSVRRTLGEHPVMTLKDARLEAVGFIQSVKTDNLLKPVVVVTLESLFENYIAGNRLYVC